MQNVSKIAGGAKNSLNGFLAAFGQPFDEVVVESTLNVKRKVNSGARQSRNGQDASVRTKRQG